MDDFKREYALLFNGITDSINTMEKLVKRLKALQQRAEEMYVEELRAAEEAENLEGPPS